MDGRGCERTLEEGYGGIVSEDRMLLSNRYEIGRLLGRGGMAEVYLARDTRLHRTVALKVLRSDLARDPHFQERFRREAQSAAGLNHPTIVGVYDTGEDHRTEPTGEEVTIPYIVMEYVEGDTLRSFISAENPMSEQRACAIMGGVLGALQYSHDAGIVHRDIKPGNIMITKNNEVKVMDFGIARAVSEATAAMTQTQAVMGTAQYLSPEQARGQQVDARSDVYSAAVVLYELLTGRPPFTGDSPVSIAYQHVRETPVVPSTYNPNISKFMDAVVLHGLAKDREVRYQSASDFAKDITDAAAGREPRILGTLAAGAAGPASAEAATQVLSPTEFENTTAFQDQETQVIPTHTAPMAPSAPAAAAVASPTPQGPRSALDEIAPEEEKKRHVGAWVAGLILLLLIVAGAAWWFIAQQNREPEQVGVPSVVGMAENDAKRTLTEAGLTPKFTEKASTEVDEGLVISTDPEAKAQVVKGSTVNVVVSSGPDSASVPKLEGLTKDEAQKALEDAGFTMTVAGTEDSTEFDKDVVIRSEPGDGASAPQGSAVKVWISSGQLTVPSVVGFTQADAEQALKDAGFEVTVASREAKDGETVGTVLEQTPADGTAMKGSTVRLVVAAEAGPVTIPNVVGQTLEEARTRLSVPELNLGTQVQEEFSPTVEKGRVIRTDPEVNSEVKSGSSVTIIVSKGPEPTPTPTPTATTTPAAPSVTPVDGEGNGNGNGNGAGNGRGRGNGGN